MARSKRHCAPSILLGAAAILVSAALRAEAPLEPGAQPPAAHAFEPGCWQSGAGMSMKLENDLLGGGPHDADYTGGLALGLTPAGDGRGGAVLRHVDRLLGVPEGECRQEAWQLALMSMTPGTLRSPDPIRDDRPFASLLILGSSVIRNTDDERVALQTTLEVGALGWDLAERVHTALHRLVGDELPQGYQHQISNGGEPTARWAIARHTLLHETSRRGEPLQTKRTLALSVGWLTEASVAWSARWGRIGSPWQTFMPSRADYLAGAAPLPPGEPEVYAFAGVRGKARAWNALVQGQFRDSEHVLHTRELEKFLGEAFVGVHWQPTRTWSVTYTYRVQTPELRSGPGRRTLVWGGLEFSRRF
jgi:hypothetical protein